MFNRLSVLLIGLLALGLSGQASATTLLPTTTFTTAVTGVVGTVYYYGKRQIDRAATIQANFVYGSGGTSVDAYVQTSLDGGTSWGDVCNFHFTTSSSRPFANVSSLTPKTTPTAETDGTLTANTCNDGLIGDRWRVKYTSVGTYAGGTTLRVDVTTDQLTTYP